MKLNKYQLGGGTEQSDQYAMLATSIQEAITRGQTPQAVYESLVARKMEQKIALQLVSSVVQNMLESGSLEEEDLQQSKQKDADAEKALLEDQQLADEELEKDNAAEEQMNAYNQQSTDVALDTSGIDQEEEDLNSMYSDDQYGFRTGGATEEEIYNSQFGKEKKAEPFSMEGLLKSTPGTQAFNFAGIQDYYMPYAPIGSSSDIEFVDFSDTPEKKYGGAHKKQFAKNVLNLLKKAEGGPQEDEVTDSNKAVQTDDLTGTVQKKQSSFVEAMGNTAKKIKIDEWFDKLKKVGDPMLDQILSPVPKEDPVQQQEQQVEQMLGQGEEEYEEEDGEEEMKFGGGKRRRQKRQYNRILNQANRLLGVNTNQSMGNRQLPFGNLPTNQYSKFSNFSNQRFNNIDAPTLQKYFIDLAKQQLAQQQDNVLIPSIDVYDRGLFGRAKKYRVSYDQPIPKSAEIQAEEVVAKNNNNAITNSYTPLNMPYEGYDDEGSIIPAPSGTIYNPINQTANKPLDWLDYNPGHQPFNAPQFNNGGQYGGFVSPSDELSPENLARFVYGGDDSYGESKNVDDPYFSDMDAYPEMGRGGNRRRAIRNLRRATNSTARDYLFPANRGIYNAGSYAQQQGMPFIAGTNNMYLGSMANMPLHSTNVTKTGIFGRPKQWTDYYGTGTGASNKQEEIKLNNQYDNEEDYLNNQRADYSGLNPMTQMKLRSADRKTDRQVARGIRKGVDQPLEGNIIRNDEYTNNVNAPLEGAITGYGNLKDLKKDQRQGTDWRQEGPIRDDEGNYYDANRNKKLPEINIKDDEAVDDVVIPKKYTDEERGIDSRSYDDLMNEKRKGKKLQDGGSPEQKFNFYEELENTMYDYEPNAYPSSYRRGGYLPKAEFGLNGTPVSYTDNPAFVGQAEVDWTGSGQGMNNTGLQPSTFWGEQASFNQAPPVNSNQAELPTQYNVDPNQTEEQQLKKQWDPNALIGVNRKRKNMIGVDPQAGLEAGNASANFVLGKIGQSKDADAQVKLYEENFDPMKLYGKKSRIDKGDWEANLGVKNINRTGSDRLGRSKKYGGGMYDGYLENEEDYLLDGEEDEENEYKKGGQKITFMSEKQIKEFLAAGGELEFI